MSRGSITNKILGIAVLWLSASVAFAADVLVSRNDGSRTSQNLSETVLNNQNVASATFGRIYSYPLDGQTYAQPLVKAQLAIPGKGTFNVVFLATEHASVYALDADTATPIWFRSFINPATGLTTRQANSSLEDLVPEVGITSTPVIDPVAGTLYVLAETVQSGQTALYWLHALDITTGADKVPPVQIQASVNGGATPLHIDAATSEQRPGLVLLNGVVYVGFGSNADNFPWVGWLLGYDATSLAQVAVFCTSPTGGQGSGLWSSGQAPPVDASGNIYIATGNGFLSVPNYGDSWVKLGTSSGLTVLDYFSPFNQNALWSADLDLAAAGMVLLPDAVGSATHPHLMVGTGKDGEMYLVDRDNMGQFAGSYTTPNHNIVQYITGQIGSAPITPTAIPLPYTPNSYTSPAYWAGHVYFCGTKDFCKAFSIGSGLLSTTPVAQAPTSFGYPGGQPVISAASASATSAILWAVERDTIHNLAVLHAYNASNIATELYNSMQAAGGRDFGGVPLSFAVPTVANGKVFVATQASVDVYGLLSGAPQRLATPTFSPAPSSYTGTQSVSISAGAGTTIHYTLDGSLPTLGSPVYTGPLTVSSTTTLKAMAVESGSLASPVASGTYTIASTAQIRYVQGNYATPQAPQSTVTVKYTSAQQQGDLNVIVVGWNDSTATVKSVSDTSGNTYTLAVGPTVLSGVASQSIYYASNIASAASNANTVTVAFNGAAVYPDIRVAEYGGIATSGALDVVAGASGSSASAASGAASTTSANDLIVGADLTVQFTAVGSGFTSRLLTVPDGDILEDRIVSATGSYNAIATISPAGQWIMQLAAFKGGSGGGGGTPTPTAPSALTATAAGATAINLGWSAATESGGSIASYLIERCAGAGCTSFAQVGTSTSTSFADSGLTAGTSYSYRVRAKDGAGTTGPYSNTASAQTATSAPSAPTSLTANAAGSTQVTLTWGAASESGGSIAAYLVERCQGAGCTSFAQVASVSSLAFTDSGLTGSTSYSYRVRAKDAVGTTGPYSSTASATTAAPTIGAPGSLGATAASSSQINLSWTAASETGGTISQYLIERCQGTGCSTFAQVATSTTTAYNDTGLTAATSYSYRVRAKDSAGNTGPYSGVASATTATGTTPPAIAFVQQASATPQSPQSKVSMPFPAAQGAGDLNVVVVGWNDATAQVGTVTDAKGNTYHLAAGPTVISGTASQAIYYAANVAAGPNSVTVTFTSAAVFPDVRVAEYSGIDPSNPLDVVATGSGNSTLSASAAVTTTNANDLIVGANLVLTTTTGAGAGFTSRVITNPDSDILEDRVVTATGSYSATVPLTPAAPWIMQLAAFRRHP